MQGDRAAVLERMRHHERRIDPDQTILLQVELADRRRSGRHRHEARAMVVHEPRQRQLAGRRRPARSRGVLEHRHLVAVRS